MWAGSRTVMLCAMKRLFEELDNCDTPIGELSLRRRRIPALGDAPIYEVKLGEEFLMSSLFVAAEEALAEQGLAACHGQALDVVVGGLGLGHTPPQLWMTPGSNAWRWWSFWRRSSTGISVTWYLWVRG